MKGEIVYIELVSQTGENDYGEPVSETEELAVDNVLCAPRDGGNASEDIRANGVNIKYTLYFPKTFDSSIKLDNLRIKVRGEWVKVIGAPRPFDDAACPTYWNMTVETEAISEQCESGDELPGIGSADEQPGDSE